MMYMHTSFSPTSPPPPYSLLKQPMHEPTPSPESRFVRTGDAEGELLAGLGSPDLLERYRAFQWLSRKANSANPMDRKGLFNPALVQVWAS